MRRKIIINPDYCYLEAFVKALPDEFDALAGAEVLRDIRNVTKAVDVAGERIVIKSYRHISPLNSLLYGTLRDSKAVRAYKYAERLIRLGVATPQPVAVIDTSRKGRLRDSFFISIYSDYKSAEMVNSYPDDGESLCPLMDSVAAFILRLHECGVLHQDLNISNILFRRRADGEYDFQIIDINRMKFKRRLSERERIVNFKSLSCSPASYAYILHQYAKLSGISEHSIEMKGLFVRIMHERRKGFLRELKSYFR